MNESQQSRFQWLPFAVWASIAVGATYCVFGAAEHGDNALLVAILIMLVSPCLAIGSLVGYSRAGLAVGIVVAALYLVAFVAVNFYGIRL